nr:hypothetical protein OG461_10660 [Streptomyces sp. NBC_00995]
MSTDDVSDYYAELGIDRNTTAGELAQLLDRATRTWTGRASRAPDPKKRREAEDKVALIGEARAHLLDPARRTAYHRRLRAAQERAHEEKSRRAVPPAPPRPAATAGGRDWVAHARQYLKQGDDDSALYELRQAVHHNERDANAWRLLGSIHAKHGQYRDALMEYERARVLYPRDSLTHTCIAVVHAAQGELGAAASWDVTAAQLSSSDSGLTLAAARALFQAAQYDEALSWYEKGLSLRPTDTGVRDSIGRIWCLRAEGAMVWHPARQRYVIASPSGATQVAHCVEQAEAVGVSDAELNARLGQYRVEAASATTRTWRGRASMLVVMGPFLVPVLMAGFPLNLLGLVPMIVLPGLLGYRPRWWHDFSSLPANARPDVRSPS